MSLKQKKRLKKKQRALSKVAYPFRSERNKRTLIVSRMLNVFSGFGNYSLQKRLCAQKGSNDQMEVDKMGKKLDSPSSGSGMAAGPAD